MTIEQTAMLGQPGERPFAVEVTRGPLVESRHLVDAAVVDAAGDRVAVWGDVERPVYARSAIKPIQALALIETGAAEAFALSNREIALACASHAGEPVHVEAVTAWLARLGLGDDDLECGAHYPRNANVLSDFARSGAVLRQAHNNCSGKHAGMLSHAVHLGEATAGYIGAEHPVQGRVREAIGAMCGLDAERAQVGIDGCGIPTLALPLSHLALAMARLCRPDDLPPGRAGALPPRWWRSPTWWPGGTGAAPPCCGHARAPWSPRPEPKASTWPACPNAALAWR